MNRISQLKEMLETNKDDSFLQHALALEYVKAGDDLTAQTLFESILAREPSYTGSYYHLGKLLERLNQIQLASEWYEKGIAICKSLNERHAFSELQGALDEITD